MARDPKRSGWARLVRFAARVVVAATVLVVGASWYASGQLLEPRREAAHYDVHVRSLGEGWVALDRTAKTTEPGIWGLAWDRGYAQVAGILEQRSSEVVREFHPLQGTLRPGQLVAMDPWAYPGDPTQAFGILFDNVDIPSELGELPAWFVNGPRDTWVIFVHGRDASRREALRMLHPVAELGFPCLVMTYRNDLGAPPSPDGLYHLGETEWKDVDAAASYAVGHGAHHLVVVGFSMGGAIVSEFLHRSARAASVDGVILDAPVLDWSTTVSLVGHDRGVPGPLMSLTKSIFSIRYEADWHDLNEMEDGARLRAPVLLFHGAADHTVPVGSSDEFAAARPSLVTYVRVAGAGHVEAWNLDPARYDGAVQGFLEHLSS